MPGLDESKQFVPLKIAVLTVSDTRSLKDDKSGALLVQRIVAAGHYVAERSIVTDDIEAIRSRVKAWVDDPLIDVVITTGGTGFTGRDVTPEAVEPLFEKKMEAFSALFLVVSFPKIGTSAIQSRATAGVANSTYIFCLPGSPGACKDAWDEILVHQLDYRFGPCNFVEIMPRLDEHLRREKAQGLDGLGLSPPHCEERSDEAIQGGLHPALDCFAALAMTAYKLQIPVLADHRRAPILVVLAAHQRKAGFLVDVPRRGEHAMRP